MIDIISATRLSSRDFWAKSALGQSLRQRANDPRIRARVTFCNRKGLPEVYNSRIEEPDRQDGLVFVHDDVWLDDEYFVESVLEGLARFDVIGVAGNRRRLPFQPAWPFTDIRLNVDALENLSGVIAHGERPNGSIRVFGDTPRDCELLDGVFLAARAHSLSSKQVRFDPRFKFHLYDMDFCRTARASGLTMSTWPVRLTHQSKGAFGGPAWADQYRTYVAKWGE